MRGSTIRGRVWVLLLGSGLFLGGAMLRDFVVLASEAGPDARPPTRTPFWAKKGKPSVVYYTRTDLDYPEKAAIKCKEARLVKTPSGDTILLDVTKAQVLKDSEKKPRVLRVTIKVPNNLKGFGPDKKPRGFDEPELPGEGALFVTVVDDEGIPLPGDPDEIDVIGVEESPCP